MNNRTTTIEEERLANLNRARKPRAAANPAAQPKPSFGEKVSQEWSILTAAVVFDILAVLPIVSVFFNLLFGVVLYLHFGSKKKKGGSELAKIGVPVVAGSIIDFFIGILPVNIGATLFRIWLD